MNGYCVRKEVAVLGVREPLVPANRVIASNLLSTSYMTIHHATMAEWRVHNLQSRESLIEGWSWAFPRRDHDGPSVLYRRV